MQASIQMCVLLALRQWFWVQCSSLHVVVLAVVMVHVVVHVVVLLVVHVLVLVLLLSASFVDVKVTSNVTVIS
jgi:hypothetical protein